MAFNSLFDMETCYFPFDIDWLSLTQANLTKEYGFICWNNKHDQFSFRLLNLFLFNSWSGVFHLDI